MSRAKKGYWIDPGAQAAQVDVLERARAIAVLDKATREGNDPAETLRDHFVGEALTLELTGSTGLRTARLTRTAREAKYRDWVRKNIGSEMTAPEVADSIGLSQPTVYKLIRENRGDFAKVTGRRGYYRVLDADLERTQ